MTNLRPALDLMVPIVGSNPVRLRGLADLVADRSDEVGVAVLSLLGPAGEMTAAFDSMGERLSWELLE